MGPFPVLTVGYYRPTFFYFFSPFGMGVTVGSPEPFNQWQWMCATVTQPSIKKGKSTKVQTDVACDFSSHSLFLLASVRKTQGSLITVPLAGAKAELLLVCNQNIICSIYKRHNKYVRSCSFFFLNPLLREQLFFSHHSPD